MATEMHNAVEQSTTSLVSGIVDDFQDLVKQQLQLTRQEIIAEVDKARVGAWAYALGGGIFLLGAFTLCLALAHCLHWATSPAGTDPAWVPLWVCYAVIGAASTLLGGITFWIGEVKFKSISPLHNPASEAMKENVEWATRPKQQA